MASSYQDQVDLLETLKGKLAEFCETLEQVAENYKSALDYMGSEGIMNESYQYFTANNLEPTVSEINNLRDNIEARDISSIQRLIDALEQLISSQQV